MPHNYCTPPRACTFTGVPIPCFGGDPINLDEEIAVGTGFSATRISEVEAENPITARNDEPQESDDVVYSVEGMNKCVSPKQKMFAFFPEKK